MNKIYKNIQKKEDDSFIVEKDGFPYHIPNNEEFKEEYDLINKYIQDNPDACSDYVEPVCEPSQKEKEDMVRMKRNSLINDADILLLKYQEQVTLGIVQENKDYYTALLQYKQALRDIPEQAGFPDDIEYPELPKYEDYE